MTYPRGVFRERLGDTFPAVFYRVCQYVGDWTRQTRSKRQYVVLGVSETVPKGVRMHPEGGAWPWEAEGLAVGMEWLRQAFLEQHPGADFADASTIPAGKLVQEQGSASVRPPRREKAPRSSRQTPAMTKAEYNEVLRQRRIAGLARWQAEQRVAREERLLKEKQLREEIRAARKAIAQRTPKPVRRKPPRPRTAWDEFRAQTGSAYSRYKV